MVKRKDEEGGEGVGGQCRKEGKKKGKNKETKKQRNKEF